MVPQRTSRALLRAARAGLSTSRCQVPLILGTNRHHSTGGGTAINQQQSIDIPPPNFQSQQFKEISSFGYNVTAKLAPSLSSSALQTFTLPTTIESNPSTINLGKSLISAWRTQGIFNIQMESSGQKLNSAAFASSKEFFALPMATKEALIDDLSYSGYIASGAEITDGIPDYSEVFTVTKDLPLTHPSVQAKWPCHGPCPWPNESMRNVMQVYKDHLSIAGTKILQLVALGLGLPDVNSIVKYTHDGWHHLRMLRCPKMGTENGKGLKGRGIGAHTDYGLLVMGAQDEVGGLYVKPPSAKAGENEWVYATPEDGVLTVMPGDMMQYITSSIIKATVHKVAQTNRERYSFAYFHEPNFCATLKPLDGSSADGIHYGTHFTNMFMRNDPDRLTTRKIEEENRMALLHTPELRTYDH